METKNGMKFFFVDDIEISFLARREWESQSKEYDFNCFIKLFQQLLEQKLKQNIKMKEYKITQREL